MDKIDKRTFKLLFALLSLVPIREEPNCFYSKKDVFKPVLRASANNTSIENATKWTKGISADAVFDRLKCLSVKDARLWFENALNKMAIKAKKKYRLTRKVNVAIDCHKMPYYGEEENVWIINSKHEKGTGKFLVVITLHIVVRGQRFTLAALPMSKLDNSRDLVEQLLLAARKHFTIGTVLLDRGFEGIDVINFLDGNGYKYIMPKKKNERTMKVMGSMYLQGKDRMPFTISQGNKSATFDLVILETKNDLVGFITNMKSSSERIGELYRKRWGIETGYSVKNDFRIVTCSNNFAARYLFVFLSFTIYNFWAFINIPWHKIGIYKITAKDLCVFIARMLDPGIP